MGQHRIGRWAGVRASNGRGLPTLLYSADLMEGPRKAPRQEPSGTVRVHERERLRESHSHYTQGMRYLLHEWVEAMAP